MKLLRPWMFKPISWLGVGLARPWLASLRYEYHALGPAVEPLTPGLKQRYIYAFWHENMLVPAQQYGPSGAQVMISKSADGQLIAVKLNLANGSEPVPVRGTINDADALSSRFPGKLPCKVKRSSPLGQAIADDGTVLTDYNLGNLTPDCTP